MSDKIVELSEARVGDHFEGKYRGHPFSGELWAFFNEDVGILRIGSTVVRGSDFCFNQHITDGVFTRPAPALPAELGTVGRATVRGVKGVRIIRCSTNSWYSPVFPSAIDFHHENVIEADTFVLELPGVFSE